MSATPNAAYGSIDTATVDSRYPFLTELGTHIVSVDEWFGRNCRDGKFADFANICVLKTMAGDASAVGQMRCRMRKVDTDGMWAKEAKERGIAMLTIASRRALGDDSFVYAAKDFTGDVLQDIHGQNGRNVAGYPVKVQVTTNKTKAGKDFTAVTYSVPTAKDLDGIEIDATGRVVK